MQDSKPSTIYNNMVNNNNNNNNNNIYIDYLQPEDYELQSDELDYGDDDDDDDDDDDEEESEYDYRQ
eukprot:UN08995